jgi:hypothetical protein
MNISEQISTIEAELESLRKKYKKMGSVITNKVKKHDKLLTELNKDNLDNPEWLIRNPAMPGAYDGLKRMINRLYGGEFNGPHYEGYIYDDNYVPIQVNFSFWLKDYDKEISQDLLKKNCDHFVENILPFLSAVTSISSRYSEKFTKMKVVPIRFNSEDTGLDYLGYEPIEGSWYHFSQRWGKTNTETKFKDWDEAFNFAYNYTNNL